MGSQARLIAVSVAAVFLVLASTHVSPREARAAFPGADNVAVSNQACLADRSVQVSLAWTSSNQGVQWLDLSLSNNNFAAGTFVGAGPLASGQNNFTWNGLLPGLNHYLRVNTFTSQGWVASNTVAFTTLNCGSLAASNLSL